MKFSGFILLFYSHFQFAFAQTGANEYVQVIDKQLNCKHNKDYLNFFFSINSDTIEIEYEFILEKSDSIFMTSLLDEKQFTVMNQEPPMDGSSWRFINFDMLKIYILSSKCIGLICPSKAKKSTFIEDVNLTSVDSRFLFIQLKNGQLKFEK